MWLPSRSSEGGDGNTVLASIPYPPSCKERVTVRDMVQMFEEDPKSVGCGHYILHDGINVGVAILRQQLSRKHIDVLVASCNTMTPSWRRQFDPRGLADPRSTETLRARTLRHLYGLSGQWELPWQHYLEELRRVYSRILLPYNVNQNHFVVFELAWRSQEGPYLKVWDGASLWEGAAAANQEEILMLIEVFFEGEKVPVRLWELGDPVQERGHGCGAFAFLIMCYRAYGMKPQGWTFRDEALARNYLWACLRKGEIISIPRRKL